MDLQMPIMDGFEASKKILELNESQNIVACTSQISKTIKLECLEIGMRDVIYKPIEKIELIKILLQYTFDLSEEEIMIYLSQANF